MNWEPTKTKLQDPDLKKGLEVGFGRAKLTLDVKIWILIFSCVFFHSRL